MPKILLILGLLAFAGYWFTKTEPVPAKVQVLTDSCINAGTGSASQCACLAQGLYERLTEKDLDQFLRGEADDPLFVDYVEKQVREVSAQCR